MNRFLAIAVAVGMTGAAGVAGGASASADTALIVPGTSPSPFPSLRAQYHFDPATRTAIGENYYDSADVPREVIAYPGSLWPITGPHSPTLSQSVTQGSGNLHTAINHTEGPIVVTGLSQGAMALNAEQDRLAADPTAPPADQLTFIKAGDPDHLFTKYFDPGTTIPVLDYTVPAPMDSQYNTIDVVHQYDIFSNPLDRPGNLLALANAVVGGSADHTATAFSDPASIPPQNVTVATNARGATTTTYFIPADRLPLTELLVQSGISESMADRVDHVMRPMVDRAYGPKPPPREMNLRLPELRGLVKLNINPLAGPMKVVSAVTNTAKTAVTLKQISKLLHPRRHK